MEWRVKHWHWDALEIDAPGCCARQMLNISCGPATAPAPCPSTAPLTAGPPGRLSQRCAPTPGQAGHQSCEQWQAKGVCTSGGRCLPAQTAVHRSAGQRRVHSKQGAPRDCRYHRGPLSRASRLHSRGFAGEQHSAVAWGLSRFRRHRPVLVCWQCSRSASLRC